MAVPSTGDLDPLPITWGASEPLARLYSARYGPLGFNPTETSQRFRPIHDRGQVVPTAFAGENAETALAEGLLRGVDAIEEDKKPRLYRREVDDIRLAAIVPRRDLLFAQLNGPGLTKLGTSRKKLIEVPAPEYPYTAQWAQAIYDCAASFDGLLWTSHQNDNAAAVILWQGRVDPVEDLSLVGEPLALDSEPGMDLVREACRRAGVDFAG
ncbi:MAG TPA: RES domain-containing protein [Solirubrobacterales bacterium]